MSSPKGSGGGWQRIGLFLPRRLRTRLFEPAYHDLIADVVERDSTHDVPQRVGARVCAIFLDCFRVGVTDLLVRERRPTRTTWTLALILVTSIVLGALGSRMELYHAGPE